MIATIQDITFDVTKTSQAGKPYTVHVVTYQPEPYQGQTKPPTTRDIFATSDVGKDLRNFKVGDNVDLTFQKEGRYSNLVKITPASSGGSTQSSAAPSKSYSRPAQDEDTSTRIARSVALKAAVDLICVMSASERKTVDPIAMAKMFEPYLTLTDVSDELTNSPSVIPYDDPDI